MRSPQRNQPVGNGRQRLHDHLRWAVVHEVDGNRGRLRPFHERQRPSFILKFDVGPEARAEDESGTPMVANVREKDEKSMIVSEVRGYRGEDFRRESMSDGVVVVSHSAKHGDCNDKIFLCRQNL